MMPPQWLRVVTPWRLLRFVNQRTRTCWAKMVLWKLGYDVTDQDWRPDTHCWDGPAGKEYDYCGKYDTQQEMGLDHAGHR